jgi:hypothetical protein
MKADLIGEPYPTDDESYGPDAVPVCGSILTEAGAVGRRRSPCGSQRCCRNGEFQSSPIRMAGNRFRVQ